MTKIDNQISKILIRFSKNFVAGYNWTDCEFKEHQGFNILIKNYTEELMKTILKSKIKDFYDLDLDS